MTYAAASTWSDDRKYLKYFLASAQRHGIQIHNADPEPWGGTDWRDIPWWRKIKAQLKFIVESPEVEIFMFTDSYDVIFAAGWPEILAKYHLLHSPIVFGTESYCWPDQNLAARYPETPHRSRFLNAGFWMGTRAAALDLLMAADTMRQHHDLCDSAIFVDLFLSGKYPIKLDTACSLLFCTNNNSLEQLESGSGKRPRCKDTGEFPCIGHGNGNSSLQPFLDYLKL